MTSFLQINLNEVLRKISTYMQLGAIMLFLFLFNSNENIYAQCATPTSIGTPTVINASCPGNGKVIVSSMTPSAASILPDYYQYALYDTSGATVIAPYQSSDTLHNIDAGVYDIYVRRVCSTGFSAPTTRRVTILNTEQMANITSITLERVAQCNNGRFRVNATGGAPLQYSLVPTLAEPEPVASYVRAPQSTNIFDSLAAGTYYVRVYNVCGNAFTQAFTVPSNTNAPYFNNEVFNPVGCDSAKLLLYVRNVVNIANTIDTSLSRLWLIWPSGITDTIRVSTTSATGSIFFPTILGHISKIDPAYNTNTAFYQNLSNYPYTFRYGFKDACGNICTDSLVLYEPDTTRIITSALETSSLSTCDSIAYSFTIRHERTTSPTQFTYHLFRNVHNFMYSIDSGATWTNATSSTFPFLSTTTSTYSDYVQLPRGTAVQIRIAYCGDTIIETINTVTQQPALYSSFSSDNKNSCLGYGGIRVYGGNTVGDSLGVQMVSAPAGQAIVPYFTVRGNGIYTTPPQFLNLLPGPYTIRFWDTIGVECPRNIERTFNITPFQFDFNIKSLCNGDLGVYETTVGQTLDSYTYLRVKILDSLGNTVIGPVSGSSIAYQTFGNKPAALIFSQAIDTLPTGTYTIRAYKYINSSYAYLDTCSYVDKVWQKLPNLLNLTPSRFIPGCSGGSGSIVAIAEGGIPPYVYQLRDSANNVVSPNVTYTNIYNDLVANATYHLQVIDSCGTVVNRTMSIGEDLAIFVRDFTTMPCPGDNVTLYMDDMPNVSYQWYKNDTLIIGADSHQLTLTNIQTATDSGEYKVEVQIGSCTILAGFTLDPNQCGIALPINLLSFNARKEGAVAVLTWATGSEHNNKGYNIQRSGNGKDWETAGFVKSKSADGNSSLRLDYQYTDATPLPGTNYYRLAQEDYDGKLAFSPIRVARFGADNTILQVYPNPAKDQVSILGMTGTNTLKLTTVEGKTLSQLKATESKASIDLSQFSSGVYILIVTNENGEQSHYKIVKE